MTLGMICFLLLVAHAICDYPLQGDAVAINKNRNAKTDLQKSVPWYYWMGSHALMHGGAVALITGMPMLGVLETACHFMIDYLKCQKIFDIHIDQLLHIVCKLVWVFIWLVFTQ